MKTLTAAALLAGFSTIAFADLDGGSDLFSLDFDRDAGRWDVVVDGVMGGRSTGNVEIADRGVLVFTGKLSLANNGGFSQTRTDVDGDRFAGADGLELQVRGDGRTYIFDVRTSNARVMAGGFQRQFSTTDGAWTTVFLPFDEFRLNSFGERVSGAPALDPARIESIGVTLGDKKEGPFRLEIDSIAAIDRDRPTGAADPSRSSDGNGLAVIGRDSTMAKVAALVETTDVQELNPTRPDASRACVRLIERAIERGVSVFNDGQTVACASIYEVTIQAIVELAADDVPATIVDRLRQGLAEGAKQHSGTDLAWTYRRTLDDAYAHLNRVADRR